MDEVKEKLAYICSQFRIEGDILVYRWIPAGHINTAYYVAVYNGKEIYQLLIQRVNTYVFRDPVGMMRNIELLTEHVRSKEPTMEKRRRLHFRHTAARKNYIVLKDGVAMGPDEPFDPWTSASSSGACTTSSSIPPVSRPPRETPRSCA